jgi:large subunit ribosomal protein L18
MKSKAKAKQIRFKRRAKRTRAVIHGTQEIPRLSVHRSLRHISAQIINDDKGVVIVSASDKDIKEKMLPVEKAKEVGKFIAEKAKAAKVDQVIFDRGAFKYHGRVAAVADGARENGLKF